MVVKSLTIDVLSYIKTWISNSKSIFWLVKLHILNELFVSPRREQLDISDMSLVNDLNQVGIVQIDNFLTAEECDDLRAVLDKELLLQNKYVWVDSFESDCRLYGAELFNTRFKDFFENNKINKIHQYFERTERNEGFVLASRIRYRPGNLGSGGGWHRDRVFLKQFKAILYLTDTHKGNGCFEYLLGSHKLSKIIWGHLKGVSMHKNRFTDREVDLLGSDYATFQAVGKKGTLLLVNTRGIHRGRPLEEGERYALTRYFFKEGIPSSIYNNYPHLKRESMS